jgi:hypothetical protein
MSANSNAKSLPPSTNAPSSAAIRKVFATSARAHFPASEGLQKIGYFLTPCLNSLSPNGASYGSPRQRPGTSNPTIIQALKGRPKPCRNPSPTSTSISSSAPRIAIERFHDSREGVVGRSAVWQNELFSEPLFSDLAELFHKFIRLHTTNDTGVDHEDDFTKMMLGMAISPGVGQLFKGFEVFRETSGVINFVRISGYSRRLTNLYIAYRLIFNIYILCFPCGGTLKRHPWVFIGNSISRGVQFNRIE